METPVVNLSDEELKTVYDPSEDLYLLIDALEEDLDILHAMKPVICLELGSGIVITALAMALKKYNAHFIAIDINPDACRATKRTSLINSVDVDVLHMNLLDYIQIRYTYDVILFNPPYVVTEYEEVLENRLIFKTWAGGNNGRQVMERIFTLIPKILSDTGLFYLVVIKENDPEYILSVFQKLYMSGKIIRERKTLQPIILSDFLDGASVKAMEHYVQEIHSGKFRKYDYGRARNLLMYNLAEPPDYDLANITVPTALFYGSGDLLVNIIDVKRLYRILPNVVDMYDVPWPKFNHLDFIWAKDAPKLVYERAFKLMKNKNLSTVISM